MADPAGKRLHSGAWFRRKFPLTVANAALARPFSWALAAVGLSPNQVTVLSAVASVAGLALVAVGQWGIAAWGAALVYLGLILDHADGQVARRTGKGSVWGMYLDSVLDRVVEAGLFVALIVPAARRVAVLDQPGWTLLPLGQEGLAILAAAAFAAVALSKYVVTYSNLLFLRAHLLAGGTAATAPPPPAAGPARRRWYNLLPGYNRDVLLAAWCGGVAAAQVPLMLLGLLAVHSLQAVAVAARFRTAHRDPAPHAGRVLDRDFH